MRQKAPTKINVQYEYVPDSILYRYKGYEEWLTGLEAFLYRGKIWMHRKEENPEEIAKQEIWVMLGFPRETGRIFDEEANVRRKNYVPKTREELIQRLKNSVGTPDDAVRSNEH